MTISLCMIVKNEEKVLARCLDSAKDIADEIVIIDTGSTDKTKEIARKYTNNVYDFKWVLDFSKARNYSFSKATKDYIMWLDADDVISKENKEKLLELKKNMDGKTDIYFLKYNTGFDENGNVNFSYYRERILKRENNYKWIGAIHEVIEPSGKCEYLDIAVNHKKIDKRDNKRNLEIFENMKKHQKLDERQQFYYARELYYNEIYDRAILEFKDFLASENGWVENKISACLDLYNCYIKIGENKKAVCALFESFVYDLPRAEACSKIGNYFFESKKYTNAMYWYEMALKDNLDMTKGGFYNLDYYGFIPHIQLCVCLYRLGRIDEATKHNEMAGKIKPKDKNYLYNKSFFDNILKQT